MPPNFGEWFCTPLSFVLSSGLLQRNAIETQLLGIWPSKFSRHDPPKVRRRPLIKNHCARTLFLCYDSPWIHALTGLSRGATAQFFPEALLKFNARAAMGCPDHPNLIDNLLFKDLWVCPFPCRLFVALEGLRKVQKTVWWTWSEHMHDKQDAWQPTPLLMVHASSVSSSLSSKKEGTCQGNRTTRAQQRSRVYSWARQIWVCWFHAACPGRPWTLWSVPRHGSWVTCILVRTTNIGFWSYPVNLGMAAPSGAPSGAPFAPSGAPSGALAPRLAPRLAKPWKTKHFWDLKTRVSETRMPQLYPPNRRPLWRLPCLWLRYPKNGVFHEQTVEFWCVSGWSHWCIRLEETDSVWAAMFGLLCFVRVDRPALQHGGAWGRVRVCGGCGVLAAAQKQSVVGYAVQSLQTRCWQTEHRTTL